MRSLITFALLFLAFANYAQPTVGVGTPSIFVTESYRCVLVGGDTLQADIVRSYDAFLEPIDSFARMYGGIRTKPFTVVPCPEPETVSSGGNLRFERRVTGWAAAHVDTDGSALWSRNATVTRLAVGTYQVVFDTPHPDGDDYPVTFGVVEGAALDVAKASVQDGTQNSAGFVYRTTIDDNGQAADTPRDRQSSFYVSTTDLVATGTVSCWYMSDGTTTGTVSNNPVTKTSTANNNGWSNYATVTTEQAGSWDITWTMTEITGNLPLAVGVGTANTFPGLTHKAYFYHLESTNTYFARLYVNGAVYNITWPSPEAGDYTLRWDDANGQLSLIKDGALLGASSTGQAPPTGSEFGALMYNTAFWSGNAVLTDLQLCLIAAARIQPSKASKLTDETPLPDR